MKRGAERGSGMTSGNEERKDAHAPLVVLIGDAQVNGVNGGAGGWMESNGWGEGWVV